MRACGKGAAMKLASGGRLEYVGGKIGKGGCAPPVVVDAQVYFPLCLPPLELGGFGS